MFCWNNNNIFNVVNLGSLRKPWEPQNDFLGFPRGFPNNFFSFLKLSIFLWFFPVISDLPPMKWQISCFSLFHFSVFVKTPFDWYLSQFSTFFLQINIKQTRKIYSKTFSLTLWWMAREKGKFLWILWISKSMTFCLFALWVPRGITKPKNKSTWGITEPQNNAMCLCLEVWLWCRGFCFWIGR